MAVTTQPEPFNSIFITPYYKGDSNPYVCRVKIDAPLRQQFGPSRQTLCVALSPGQLLPTFAVSPSSCVRRIHQVWLLPGFLKPQQIPRGHSKSQIGSFCMLFLVHSRILQQLSKNIETTNTDSSNPLPILANHSHIYAF